MADQSATVNEPKRSVVVSSPPQFVAESDDGTIVKTIHKGETHLVGEGGSIILVPTPSRDPADPLNWSSLRKWIIVVLLVIWCGSGLSVQQFITNILPSIEIAFPTATPAQINLLVSVVTPLIAPGELLLVPVAITYGRRPAILISIVVLLASTILAACATSYEQLLGARILQGFACGPTDAIIFTIVQDLSFQHQRGVMLGLAMNGNSAMTYLFAIITPYMVNFKWPFVMFSALFGVSLVAIFFMMPETSYDRTVSDTLPEVTVQDHKALRASVAESTEYPPFDYKRQIQLFHKKAAGPDGDFFNIFRRMGLLMLNPVVWWNALLNSIVTGAMIAYSTYFASLLVAPPWSWPSHNVGLINIAAIFATIISWFLLGWANDKVALHMAKRNFGISIPEHRLILLAFPVVAGFAGFVGFGVLAQNYIVTNPGGAQPHWFSLVAVSFLIMFCFVGVLEVTYTYLASTTMPTDSLAAMTVVSCIRDLVSFGMSYGVIGFANDCGYEVSFGVYAMLVAFFGLLGIPVYFYGRRLRPSVEELRMSVVNVDT